MPQSDTRNQLEEGANRHHTDWEKNGKVLPHDEISEDTVNVWGREDLTNRINSIAANET